MLSLLKSEWMDLPKVLGLNTFTFAMWNWGKIDFAIKFLLAIASLWYTGLKILDWYERRRSRKAE